MKRLLIICTIVLVSSTSWGQINITRYHMRDNLIYTQDLNASFFPRSNFYFSLPAIGNLNFDVNLPIAYSDLFEVTGDSVRVKIDSYLNSSSNDFIGVNTNIPVFGLGFRVGETGAASLFVNSRNSFAFGMPKDIARWAWNGNGEYLGEQYVVDDIMAGAMSYVEIGVGYSRDLEIAGQSFRVGGRAKYLAGLAMAELDNKAAVNILTNSNSYQTTFTFNNATLRMAGIDIDDEDNVDEGLINGELGGSGFALDFGAQYYFSDRWNFNFAINDMGFINWNTAAKEISIQDESVVFEGVDITADNFSDNFQEQFEDVFEADTIDTNFATSLNTSVFMGSSYRVTKGGTASATLANSFEFGELRTAIGLGYTQQVGRVLAVSGTFSKTPQQPIDFGAGMMLNSGLLQLHIVADGLLKYTDLTNTQRVNFSFGLNIAIGNPDKGKKIRSPKPEKEKKNKNGDDAIDQMIKDLEQQLDSDG